LLSKIKEISIEGGTTLEAGLSTGLQLFKDEIVQVKNRQKRILFITDMCDMTASELDFLI